MFQLYESIWVSAQKALQNLQISQRQQRFWLERRKKIPTAPDSTWEDLIIVCIFESCKPTDFLS